MNCRDGPVCDESTSACRGTLPNIGGEQMQNTSSLGCAIGTQGVFCKLCAERNDGVRVFYSRSTQSAVAMCKPCKDTAQSTILLYVGLGIAAIALLLLFFFILKRLSIELQERLSRVWLLFNPHVKLKILISFYMIATKVDDVYEVNLPASVKNLLEGFAIGLSFGFSSLGNAMECLGYRGYVPLLLTYTVTPLGIALLISIVLLSRAILLRKCTAAFLLESLLPPLLKLGFLAYPLVSKHTRTQ